MLVSRGLIKKIPISDEQVIIVLRNLGFEKRGSMPGPMCCWRLEKAPNFIIIISFVSGKVKAVADKLDIKRIRGGIKAVVYYKIVGISGDPDFVKIVKQCIGVPIPAVMFRAATS